MKDPRTLEAFSKCKICKDFDALCDSVKGCSGCSLDDFGKKFNLYCYRDWEKNFKYN